MEISTGSKDQPSVIDQQNQQIPVSNKSAEAPQLPALHYYLHYLRNYISRVVLTSEASEQVKGRERRPRPSLDRKATGRWVGPWFLFATQLLAIITLVSCTSNIAGGDRVATADPAYRLTAKPLDPIVNSHSDCSAPSPIRSLLEHRTGQGNSYDFPIGPGDVLHIQVADLKEFNQLTVRVDGDGTIDLPLIGNMAVAGMNEDQVRQAISDRVSDYVINPRVHVFISQYYSRSVAVMGMVAKPGAYPLAGPSDSILDIIGRAGGMREGAAQRVVFFPVETNPNAVNRDASSYRKVACADESNGHRRRARRTARLPRAISELRRIRDEWRHLGTAEGDFQDQRLYHCNRLSQAVLCRLPRYSCSTRRCGSYSGGWSSGRLRMGPKAGNIRCHLRNDGPWRGHRGGRCTVQLQRRNSADFLGWSEGNRTG